MTTTPFNPDQNAFLVAVRELGLAEKKVAELAEKLPAIPDDVFGEFQIAEYGYSRYETLDIVVETDEDGTITRRDHNGRTDGWDSMSEYGYGEHVVIDGLPYLMPEDVEWD